MSGAVQGEDCPGAGRFQTGLWEVSLAAIQDQEGDAQRGRFQGSDCVWVSLRQKLVVTLGAGRGCIGERWGLSLEGRGRGTLTPSGCPKGLFLWGSVKRIKQGSQTAAC